MDLFQNLAVVTEMGRAWIDSQPSDPTHRHEEGGYIVSKADGSYGVERWRRGAQSRIQPPSLDANNRYNGIAVLATFHTHPNPPVDEGGQVWEQAPSASDRRWHSRRKLRGFVISESLIYEIDSTASVVVLGKRDEVLST